MTYTDEEAGVVGVGDDVAPGDLGPGNGADGQGEEDIVYPPRRAQVAMDKFWRWAAPRLKPLAHVEVLVTFFVVALCVAFVAWQFQLSQVFRNTTISGGDTGAHVLLPWVAIHQLLPHLRLTGWTSSNWDGFPAVTFYFPLPIYAIVAATPILGYDIAFKLMTAAPMIFMPVAGWLLGRLARAPFPVPAVLAVATLPYIFGNEYEIYGGNILSTLAGEFAFAWSLWFALVFLGLCFRGLQTGRYRAWAAVLFALCFMSHIDPAMFALIGFVVIVFTYAVRSRDWVGAFWWSFPTIVVGGLLAAWWALPFNLRLLEGYVTNMGYQRITTYLTTLFPTADTWLFILAGMGAMLSIARRRRMGEFLFTLTVLAAVAFRYMPQSILWNARVLPFWFLCLYLLGGLAVAEMYAIVAERSTGFLITLRAALLPAPVFVLLLALIWVGFPLRILPTERSVNGNYSFLGIPQKSASVVPSWISWNYSGYQYTCTSTTVNCDTNDVKSGWTEYNEIVKQLETAAKTYGCGSVMWEYNSSMNRYGTPDALTILPYWTNGCIGSMEGLYYEASATTPFHFINQSELSLQPSDPMVGLTYASSPNVALGVEHLQMLGVKYYMAINTELQTQAAADPSLKLISTFGPYSTGESNAGGSTTLSWKLYLVLNSPRVHPLTDQPVVMDGLRNTSQPKWLNVMQNWYADPSAWDVYLAAEGPKNWARVPYGDDTNLPVTPEPSTTVSDIVEHNASISFNVSRIGVPVVVSISYFPNWEVSGAQGVYRVSPNLMVVVPTSHHVSLWYGTSAVDYEGYLLTILALVGLVVLVRRPVASVAAMRRPALGYRGLGPDYPPPGPVQSAVSQRLRSFWAGKDAPAWPTYPDGPASPAQYPDGGHPGGGNGMTGNGHEPADPYPPVAPTGGDRGPLLGDVGAAEPQAGSWASPDWHPENWGAPRSGAPAGAAEAPPEVLGPQAEAGAPGAGMHQPGGEEPYSGEPYPGEPPAES